MIASLVDGGFDDFLKARRTETNMAARQADAAGDAEAHAALRKCAVFRARHYNCRRCKCRRPAKRAAHSSASGTCCSGAAVQDRLGFFSCNLFRISSRTATRAAFFAVNVGPPGGAQGRHRGFAQVLNQTRATSRGHRRKGEKHTQDGRLKAADGGSVGHAALLRGGICIYQRSRKEKGSVENKRRTCASRELSTSPPMQAA